MPLRTHKQAGSPLRLTSETPGWLYSVRFHLHPPDVLEVLWRVHP